MCAGPSHEAGKGGQHVVYCKRPEGEAFGNLYVKTAARRPVPNERGELSEPGEPSGPNLVEFQGGEFLRVVHRGSYLNLPETFHRLLKLAKDGGIDIEPLPLIQIYRNSPNFTPEAELETEVLVRVKYAKK